MHRGPGIRTRRGRAGAGRSIVATGAGVVLALATWIAPAAADTPTAHSAAGHLVLIGGALGENARIFRHMIALADPDGAGDAVATVAVVTAGSIPAENPRQAANPDADNATANGRYYVDLFTGFGARAFVVPIDEAVNYRDDPYVPANADDPDLAEQVGKADLVFFGGGDQIRYLRTMVHCDAAPHEAYTSCKDSVVMTAVRSVIDGGGVVAGTSAGLTIEQATPMVTGGESYQGWRDGATAGYYDSSQLAYVPYGGFGFFSGGLLDSHFATRSRQARMIRLALDRRVDVPRIYGVDETTALIVDRATGRASVIGRHGVSVLDVSHATLDGTAVHGVRWSYANQGDHVNVETGRVQRAAGSEAVVGSGPKPPTQRDIWDSPHTPHYYSMRDLAVDLLESAGPRANGVTYEHRPSFRTVLAKHDRTTAWLRPHHNVSFSHLGIRIKECCGGT